LTRGSITSRSLIQEVLVSSSVLTVIACAPIFVGWLAVCVCKYRLAQRRRLHGAQWAAVAATLTELDAELDRTWTEEQERIRRYQ
jgi:hypothetical protein